MYTFREYLLETSIYLSMYGVYGALLLDRYGTKEMDWGYHSFMQQA